MSDTYRRMPSHCMRRPKTSCIRRQEEAANNALEEYGVHPNNREQVRGTPSSTAKRSIPNAWLDNPPAALKEIPPCKLNKKNYKKINRKIK